ncbi:MAG: DegQ family serine endoprotease [Pseudomonadales bacterium]
MKARHRNLLIAASVVAAFGVGAAGGQAIALPDSAETPAPIDVPSLAPMHQGFSALVKAVKPAVVNVSISGHRSGPQGGPMFQFPEGSPFEEFFEQYFGSRGPFGPGQDFRGERGAGPAPEFRAVGSGFIISPDGLVVTNNHVIDRAEQIDVILQDGKRYSATVQGRDPKTDIALLKVETDEVLPYVEFGDSNGAEVGDWVVAVGNPFGLGGTVTAGILSARGRDIQAGPFDDFLQVDAPINRGNSGGPLFDSEGRVIGINTAIYSPSGGSVGIGFAIPSELAVSIIDQLKDSGTVERGWLGVEYQPVTEAVAASLGLDGTGGALVASVVEGGPAEKAGVKMGDVILSLDGKPLADPKDLPRLVAGAKAGEKVDLTVLRNGKEKKLGVEIGRSEPDTAELAAVPASAKEPARLGVQLSALTPEVRQRYGLEASSGVLVTDVQRGSPASKAGIRPGQIITMVGQTAVTSPTDVVREVEKAAEEGRPSVLLMVEQRGARQFVAVELAA